jgi:hypothetical protein
MPSHRTLGQSSRIDWFASDVARRLAFIAKVGICCLGSNTSKMTKIQYLPAMGFGLRPAGLLTVPETVAACRMSATFGVDPEFGENDGA